MPIYIGASGPAATRLAGRIADGYITTSGKKPELYTETLLPALREGLAKAGRARRRIDTLIEVKVSFDPDRRALREDPVLGAARAVARGEDGRHDPIEMQRLADELPIERAASRFIVSDDPDEHVERSRGTSTWASATSSSTTPVTTRRSSCARTAPRSCRGCGRGIRNDRAGR